MNTSTNKEWGNGEESPLEFKLDPASLDTDQWVSVIKVAGFKRIIFVAKHHDGFCNIVWKYFQMALGHHSDSRINSRQ
jgi:alpha-L-fucosidase